MTRLTGVLVLVGVLGATGVVVAAEVPSAKQAIAIANEQLDQAVKDQVIVMRGSLSDSNLRPRIWDITFYDETRLNDGTTVRVKDGGVTSVSSSVRMFDDGRTKNFSRNFSGYWPEEVIDMGRWAKDSDQVVALVTAHPKLAEMQVTELTLWLRKPTDGEVPPIWRIRVRARPKDDPTRERWVGYLQYNADSGELLLDELTLK